MRLLYVPLSAETIDRLCRLAKLERREPREQAAYLLDRAIETLVPADSASCVSGTNAAEVQPGQTALVMTEQLGRIPEPGVARLRSTRRWPQCPTDGEASDEPGA